VPGPDLETGREPTPALALEARRASEPAPESELKESVREPRLEPGGAAPHPDLWCTPKFHITLIKLVLVGNHAHDAAH
jgi:hypothetical protein